MKQIIGAKLPALFGHLGSSFFVGRAFCCVVFIPSDSEYLKVGFFHIWWTENPWNMVHLTFHVLHLQRTVFWMFFSIHCKRTFRQIYSCSLQLLNGYSYTLRKALTDNWITTLIFFKCYSATHVYIIIRLLKQSSRIQKIYSLRCLYSKML